MRKNLPAGDRRRQAYLVAVRHGRAKTLELPDAAPVEEDADQLLTVVAKHALRQSGSAGAAVGDDLADSRPPAVSVRLAGGIHQRGGDSDEDGGHSGPRAPVDAELVELGLGRYAVLVPAAELVVLLQRRPEASFSDRPAG